ncbi:hypothetical protein LA080_012287 [Diaporthe eres]|nr:hypothetical protein LA080_012287 [Diaporthe eres]
MVQGLVSENGGQLASLRPKDILDTEMMDSPGQWKRLQGELEFITDEIQGYGDDISNLDEDTMAQPNEPHPEMWDFADGVFKAMSCDCHSQFLRGSRLKIGTTQSQILPVNPYEENRDFSRSEAIACIYDILQEPSTADLLRLNFILNRGILHPSSNIADERTIKQNSLREEVNLKAILASSQKRWPETANEVFSLHRYPEVLELGVILLELHLGQRLEDFLGLKRELSGARDFFLHAMKAFACQKEHIFSLRYRNTIDTCLRPDPKLGLNPTMQDVRMLLFQCVVRPLEEELTSNFKEWFSPRNLDEQAEKYDLALGWHLPSQKPGMHMSTYFPASADAGIHPLLRSRERDGTQLGIKKFSSYSALGSVISDAARSKLGEHAPSALCRQYESLNSDIY